MVNKVLGKNKFLDGLAVLQGFADVTAMVND